MKPEYNLCYESDFSRLKGKVKEVIFPKNAEEIANVIKTAQVDIVPRGFGVSSAGGCVPDNSVVLDMRKMNKVTNFNSKEKSVWAEAGISVKELNEKLKAVGFEFPIFDADKSLRSVGGMIALDCFGDRYRYGSVRDWVDKVETVNGRGEIFRVGKADLMDVCGMEGITGVIVKAKLKISPLIKRSASIFQSDDLAEALSMARRLRLDKEIVMLKFYSSEISKMLGFPEKYHLIIEFNSLRGKIKGESYDKLVKKMWKINFALFSKDYHDSLGVKLFFDKIPEFAGFLEENKIPYTGDLGSGIIYSFFRGEEKQKILNFLKNTKAKFIGGFGIKKKDLIEFGERKILQRIKKRYDPFNKINKNKVIDFERRLGSEESLAPRIKKSSPVKEIETFIEGVRLREEKDRQINNFVEKIEKGMDDYEQIFSIPDEKRKEVEKFSYEVPREILKEEDKRVDELIKRKDDGELKKGDELKSALDKLGLGAGFDKKEEDD